MGVRHVHTAQTRQGPSEQRVGNEIVTYYRCTCSCGYTWNDVVARRKLPSQ